MNETSLYSDHKYDLKGGAITKRRLLDSTALNQGDLNSWIASSWSQKNVLFNSSQTAATWCV